MLVLHLLIASACWMHQVVNLDLRMFSGVLLSMYWYGHSFKIIASTFFNMGCTFFTCIIESTFFYFILLGVSYIHFVAFRLREIFALFFTYSIGTDSISVILCNKYSVLDTRFCCQIKIQYKMLLIRSWFVLSFAFCSPFVPCEGHGGVYRMYICTLQHTRFWVLAYFSVYNEQHTAIIMQLGTL